MQPYVISFDSYAGGTGKTTAALNVGALMAASGKRTLLVDFDLRKPGLTKLAREVAIKQGRTPAHDTGSLAGVLTEYLCGHDWPSYLQGSDKSDNKWPLPREFKLVNNGALCYLPAVSGTGVEHPSVHNYELEQLTHFLYTMPRKSRKSRDRLPAYNGMKKFAQDFRGQLETAGFDYVLVDCPAGINWESELTSSHLADHVVLFSDLTGQNTDGTGSKFGDIIRVWYNEQNERATRHGGDYGKLVLVAGITSPYDHGQTQERFQAQVDRMTLRTVGPEKSFPASMLLNNYAGYLPDDGLVVAQYKRGMADSTPLFYHGLHSTLRDASEDGEAAWAKRTMQGWNSGDYGLVAQSLEARNAMMSLSPYLSEHDCQTILRPHADILLRLPDEEFGKARVVAGYIASNSTDEELVSKIRARLREAEGITG